MNYHLEIIGLALALNIAGGVSYGTQRIVDCEEIAHKSIDRTLLSSFEFVSDQRVVLSGVTIPDSVTSEAYLGGRLVLLDLPTMTVSKDRHFAELPMTVGTSRDGRFVAVALLDYQRTIGKITVMDADFRSDQNHEYPWQPPVPQNLSPFRDPTIRIASEYTARSIGFSPDGSELHAYGGWSTKYAFHGKANLIGKKSALFDWIPSSFNPSMLCVDPVNGRIAYSSKGIHILNYNDLQPSFEFRHRYTDEEAKQLFDSSSASLSWSPDGRFLFSSSYEPFDFTIWDTATKETILRECRLVLGNRTDSDWVSGGAISTGGTFLAIIVNKPTIDENRRLPTIQTREIRVYDTRSRAQIGSVDVISGSVLSMKFLPDSDRFATIIAECDLSSLNAPRLSFSRLMQCAKSSRIVVYEIRRTQRKIDIGNN